MTEKKTKPRGKPFEKGRSGNPKGRPKGSGEVAKIRAALIEHIPHILEAMYQRALDGDTGAARLLLERCVAPLKAMEPTQPLDLPDGSLTEKGHAILAAVSSGELSPSTGALMLDAIARLVSLAEAEGHERRIAALEALQLKS